MSTSSESFVGGLIIIVLVVLLITGFLIKGERFEMKQAASGKVVSAKRGFSFTYLFFGPFVPLFRGHISGFFLTLLITLCSCGLGHLILLFVYNGMHINWLANQGFTRMDIPQPDSRPVQVLIQNQYGEYSNPVEEAGVVKQETAAVEEAKKKSGGILDKLKEIPSISASQPLRERPRSSEKEMQERLTNRAYGLPTQRLITTKTKESEAEQVGSWKLIPTKDTKREFWLPGAPVILTKMQLFENIETQEIYLGVGIQNLVEEMVTAIYMDIIGFNVLKKKIVELKDVNYLDMCLKKGEVFFPTKLFPLEDKTVRRCEVVLRHVVFFNDEIWDYTGDTMFPLLSQQATISYPNELRETLHREIKTFTKTAATAYQFVPEEIEGGWYCGCGQFNPNNEKSCSACHIEKEAVFEVMGEPFLQERNVIYQEEQKRLYEVREQKRLEEAERLCREREERERQERLKVEERDRKIEKIQGNVKEKAQEAMAAAAVYYGKGKEKIIELSEKVKQEAKEEQITQEKSTIIFCSQCGIGNAPDSMYCIECGAKLEL